jgi:hypothetical protein
VCQNFAKNLPISACPGEDRDGRKPGWPFGLRWENCRGREWHTFVFISEAVTLPIPAVVKLSATWRRTCRTGL